MRSTDFLRRLTAMLAVLTVFACSPFSLGISQRPKHYMLSSLYSADSQVAPIAELDKVVIGVGPLRFPRHLDRKEIVTRTSDNEVMIDEFALWAGPLSENFNSVLAENLSILLSTNQVVIFPWRSQYPVKYQIVVHVIRLDGQLGKEAWLRARWIVLDEQSKEILQKDLTTITEPAGSATLEALVAAESRAVVRLSREIARAIADLETKAGKPDA